MKIKSVADIKESSWNLENTPSMLARTMFYYIQSVGFFDCNIGYITDRSDYDTMLLVYTVNGEGILQYQDQTYRIGKGQVFIIDCLAHHLYGTADSGSWEFRWIHFNGSESRNYITQILKNSGPVFNVDKDSCIPEYMNKILTMMDTKDKRMDILASKLIVEILTELLLKSCGTDSMQESHIPESIQLAVNIIEKNHTEPMNLDKLSSILCVSKYHLSRLFKKHTGYSPYEYFIKQRMNHAKDLLKSTELSIGEISRDVGFESTSHFIKLFHQHEKITPLKFRAFWR